jgi:hypothetical protein
MRDELPALGELSPQAGFLDDVLKATVGARRPAFGERLTAAWGRLVQRPRIAWEVAYVGAMLVWLIFGTPASLLQNVARQTRDMAGGGTLPSPAAKFDDVKTRVTTIGSDTWTTTREAWLISLDRLQGEVRERYERTSGDSPQDAEPTAGNEPPDPRASVRPLRALAGDARRILNRLMPDKDNEERSEP